MLVSLPVTHQLEISQSESYFATHTLYCVQSLCGETMQATTSDYSLQVPTRTKCLITLCSTFTYKPPSFHFCREAVLHQQIMCIHVTHCSVTEIFHFQEKPKARAFTLAQHNGCNASKMLWRKIFRHSHH